MKKTILAGLVIFALVFSIFLTIPEDWTQTADATKASGVKIQKYGQATKSIVCGDRLCSEKEPMQKEMKTKPMAVPSEKISTQDFQSMIERMNRIHESHIDQMKSMWSSMAIDEQNKMFSHMKEMMTQMESMDMMDHMKMMTDKHHDDKMMKDLTHDDKMMGDKSYDKKMKHEPNYNPDLNPRQVSYPAIKGFNDLHIEAIRHIIPNGDDSLLDVIVHHHCKVYYDMTAACLLFPTGMEDQDKPYGMEYVITSEMFKQLPEEEKSYWHYHLTELPKVQATLPDLTPEEAAPLMPILNETYGKVIYFWQLGDEFPIGDPFVVIIQDLYE